MSDANTGTPDSHVPKKRGRKPKPTGTPVNALPSAKTVNLKSSATADSTPKSQVQKKSKNPQSTQPTKKKAEPTSTVAQPIAAKAVAEKENLATQKIEPVKNDEASFEKNILKKAWNLGFATKTILILVIIGIVANIIHLL